MKKSASLFVAAFTLLSSVPSFALVRELDQCTTRDGQFSVSVMDNQGIGPVRTSNVFATVRDSSDEIVASYKVTEKTGPMSISFGRAQMIDTQTGGSLFDLAGPSTNFRTISLLVKLQSGPHAGQVLKEDGLGCTIFNGTLLTTH